MTTLNYGLDLLLRQSPISVPIINSYVNSNNLFDSSNVVDESRMSPYLVENYNYPRYVVGYYPDLDKDPQVHNTLKKYYFYKLLDKWMYRDLKSLLAYVSIDGGKAKLINSISDYNENSVNNSKENDLTLRVKFLEDLISKDLVKSVLERIVNKYGIHWYQLNKNEDIVKKKLEDAVKEFLVSKIKKNK
jgi:ribosomal protein L17